MEKHTLQAEVREQSGKGPARRLRASGKIPGVFYGANVEPKRLAVSPKALTKILSSEFGRNSLIELQFEGKSELSMVRDLQIDPLRRDLVHADFYKISEELPVKTTVPFKAVGRAAGVIKGGELQVVYRELPVRALPASIPAKIEVDVSPMELHDVFHVSDLKLPEHVEVTLPAKTTLIAVQTERRRVEASAESETAEGTEAAASGAEAGSTPPKAES